jgi:hypothetical protein
MTIFCPAAVSIFWHHDTTFIQRTQAVDAQKRSDNKYKIQFPFLASGKDFENSIQKFKTDNPSLSITYVYTAPAPLRFGESDGLIIYLQTEAK